MLRPVRLDHRSPFKSKTMKSIKYQHVQLTYGLSEDKEETLKALATLKEQHPNRRFTVQRAEFNKVVSLFPITRTYHIGWGITEVVKA